MGITTVNCAIFSVGSNDGGNGKNSQAPDNKSSNKNAGPAASVYTLIIAIAIGVGLGVALDKHFDTKPWWTLSLSMLFLIAGFYNLIKESNR